MSCEGRISAIVVLAVPGVGEVAAPILGELSVGTRSAALALEAGSFATAAGATGLDCSSYGFGSAQCNADLAATAFAALGAGGRGLQLFGVVGESTAQIAEALALAYGDPLALLALLRELSESCP